MSKRSIYTNEFKRSSVELALNSDQAYAETAKDLGIHITTFYNWIKRYRESSQAKNSSNIKPSLDEEVKRLRRENARLKEEREILKKAAVFFAKEQF